MISQAAPALRASTPDAPASDLVLVCAWCTDRWDGDRWVAQPIDAPLPTGATLTHGLCESCAAAYFPGQRRSA